MSSPDAISERVKVAFVIQTFHPVVGGAERQLLALLPRMQRAGIEPLVITRGLSGEAADVMVDGIPVRRCGHQGYGMLGSLMFLLGALWLLFRFRPGVVHGFSLMTPTTIGSIYRWLTRTPLVVKSLGGGMHGDFNRISRKAFFGIRRWLLRHSIDVAQVISAEIDEEFAQLGLPADHRYRIPNGVDIDTLSNPAGLRDFRAELQIAPTATVFLYVGRIVPGKNIDLLVTAFIEGFAEHRDAWLLLAGDGPELPPLREQVLPYQRIVVLGSCEQIPDLLAAATVFVQPSSSEGMSNSLLEAMAAGLPIVATDVGAASELLGDAERGVIIQPDDMDAIKRAMLKLSADPQRAMLGQKAHQYVSDHHSLSITSERLVGLYQQLVLR